VVAYAESATYSTEREAVVGAALGGYETAAPFEPGVLEELLELAWADLEALPPVSRRAKRYYLRGLRRRVLERTGERGPRCVALRAHMRMLPNGDVPTCQFNGRVVGNLRRRSAAEIWASEEAREQRAWVDRCAGCWAECEVLPNALYTLELFGAPTAR
jgi:MoaA/NifB/PqqE/SkfB family radical SAM enzyme